MKLITKKIVSKVFLAILTLTAINAYGVDVLLGFTSSGRADATDSTVNEQNDPSLTTEAAFAASLIDNANDIFENNGLGRPFNLVGIHTFTGTVTPYTGGALRPETGTIDPNNNAGHMLDALIQDHPDDWVQFFRSKQEILRADITVIVWGEHDLPNDSNAGMSNPGSGYLMLRGRFAGIDAIFEHELGHEFGLADTQHPNPDSCNFAESNCASNPVNCSDIEVGYTPSIMSVFPSERQCGSGMESFLSSEIQAIINSSRYSENQGSDPTDTYIFNDQLFDNVNNAAIKFTNCSLSGRSLFTTGNASNLTFSNQSTEVVDVYWIKSNGASVHEMTLTPGGVGSLNTYTGHSHRVSSSNHCIGYVRNSDSPWETVEILDRP